MPDETAIAGSSTEAADVAVPDSIAAQHASAGPQGQPDIIAQDASVSNLTPRAAGNSAQLDASARDPGNETSTAANSAATAPNAVAPGGAAPRAEEPGDSSFTARQVGAARRFGFAEEDLVVIEALGPAGKALLERLVKADSDIGRRYSRLGRAEQDHAGEQPGREESQTNAAMSVTGGPADGEPAVMPAGDDEQGDGAAESAQGSGAEPSALAEELTQLRGQVAELAQAAQQAVAERDAASEAERTSAERFVTSGVERFFAQLDAVTYGQFGRGPSEALSPDSAERRSRQELLAKADEIRRGHEGVHASPMDVEESLRQALAIVDPDAPARRQREQLARQVRLRSAQILARPSQRRGADALESAADKTSRALEEWQSMKGVRFFED